MYLRSTPRRNKDGTEVRYLQLAHNVWDRRREAVEGPGHLQLRPRGRRRTGRPCSGWSPRSPGSWTRTRRWPRRPAEGLEFTESRPLGGTWVLDGLWARLGIGVALRRLLKGRRLDDSAERVLFALVANRALAPSSKLAAARWVSEDVLIEGLPATTDDACYRAMDWLLEVRDALEKEVFGQVANLLNLEVDLLFFDTTSTYFETGEADEPVARDERGLPAGDGDDGEHARRGFRAYGKSKDHRDDLPQVVIGMAVTRDGIPVRIWCWPGDTADSALIRQVKDDMRDWTLSKIVWVADRGFASAENRRYLRRGDHHYIIGEKLRSGSAEATAALSRQGRYQDVTANLRVKEVRISEDERFVICYNPDGADRDAAIRARMLAQLQEMIDGSDKLSRDEAGRAARGHLHQARPEPLPAGHPRRAAPHRRRQDQGRGEPGRQVPAPHLRPQPPAEDIALGYKQLLEVERGWRDMKQVIDLRPVYHRKEERIRAHVILCWLALLLIRIAETTCHATWPQIRRELDRIHIGTFTGPAGTFRQRTEITKTPARHPQPAPDRPAAEDLPAHPRHAADQHEHPRLDTRPPPRPDHVPARQHPDSSTIAPHQLRNPGW